MLPGTEQQGWGTGVARAQIEETSEAFADP